MSLLALASACNVNAPSVVIPTNRPCAGADLLADEVFLGSGNLAAYTSSRGQAWQVARGRFEVEGGAVTNLDTGNAYAGLDVRAAQVVVESTITVPNTRPVYNNQGDDWYSGIFGAATLRDGTVWDGVVARFIWQDGSSEIEVWEFAEGKSYLTDPRLRMSLRNISGHIRPGGTYTLRLIVGKGGARAYMVGKEAETTALTDLGLPHGGTQAGISVNDSQGDPGTRWHTLRVCRGLAEAAQPPAPSGLKASPSGASLTLSWSAQTGAAAGHHVWGAYPDGGVFFGPTALGESTSGQVRPVDLRSGVPITFRVRSFNAAGNVSGWSAPITFTPSATRVAP